MVKRMIETKQNDAVVISNNELTCYCNTDFSSVIIKLTTDEIRELAMLLLQSIGE